MSTVHIPPTVKPIKLFLPRTYVKRIPGKIFVPETVSVFRVRSPSSRSDHRIQLRRIRRKAISGIRQFSVAAFPGKLRVALSGALGEFLNLDLVQSLDLNFISTDFEKAVVVAQVVERWHSVQASRVRISGRTWLFLEECYQSILAGHWAIS